MSIHSTATWHGGCLGAAVKRIDPVPPPSTIAPRRIPPNDSDLPPGTRRLLEGRGVDLRADPGEAPEDRRRRLETALMASFRDRPGEESFEALYRFTEPLIRRWVQSALGDRGRRADPGEYVQDAFVNIYRYAGSFRDEHAASFRSWAQAICRNAVRRAFLRPRGALLSDLPQGLDEPADGRVGPLEQLSGDEQGGRMARALLILLAHYSAAYERLSPRDRLALHLVEIEGLSYGEAGARLRVGMSNMKMIMFRARRRVRTHMTRAMGIEEARAASRAAS